MALSLVRKVRAFALFLISVNLGLTIATYIHIGKLLSNSRSNSKSSSSSSVFPLAPINYLEITAATFLFFGYLYSLFANLLKLNRVVRALLLSILAIILLVVNIIFMVDLIKDNKTSDENGDVSNTNPFSCPPFAGDMCYVSNANMFGAIITGLFVLVEVVVTLFVKEKKKEPKYIYDEQDDDDSDGGSIIVF
ncbi:hypothetical protein BGZ96_002814 [Linnemannia gamsii]|uniref:MARVEL domain-containing protein n=1 Tax=Linnemannia gamsii TaxID=64522 RepID=A0ABQ7KAI4_9FUNG|nr:hypothetical protein BGZ96_002814 [Linnemannia gamsii]